MMEKNCVSISTYGEQIFEVLEQSHLLLLRCMFDDYFRPGEHGGGTEDYSMGLSGLPKSDVLKYFTALGSVVVRPSGTEPKLKTYISVTSVTAEDKAAAEEIEKNISIELEKRLK